MRKFSICLPVIQKEKMEENGGEEIFGETEAEKLEKKAHRHICENVSMNTHHSSLEAHGA